MAKDKPKEIEVHGTPVKVKGYRDDGIFLNPQVSFSDYVKALLYNPDGSINQERIREHNESLEKSICSRKWCEQLLNDAEGWLNISEEQIEKCKAEHDIDDPLAIKDLAAHLKNDLELLEKSWKKKDYKHALWWAFKVGLTFKTMQVLMKGVHNARGRKVLDAAKDGHEATHGTQAAKEKRWEGYYEAFTEIQTRKPGLSKSRCYEIVAENSDPKCCAKTVQRAVKQIVESKVFDFGRVPRSGKIPVDIPRHGLGIARENKITVHATHPGMLS